ncbi:MAG: right-handed parallel beta-helix repeat-containing protein [Verrucomicrobia bacterium]|nr:right-handed parallel beta-helix repeat-containing protein [Verrucomicrobiota bacterium]
MKKLLSMFLAVGLLGAGEALSASYSVPGDYPTILDAIRSAPDGSEIVVAPGVYNEFLDVFAVNSTLTIRSSGGAANTIIDGQGVSKLAQLNGQEVYGSYQLTFDGFTFANGRAYGDASPIAVVEYSPIFRNCVFENNYAEQRGGAIRILGGASDVRFENCTFRNNVVENIGGGAVLVNAGSAQAVFVDCLFDSNSAVTPYSSNLNHGGAIYYSQGGGQVVNCTFLNNKSTYTSGAIMILSPFGQNEGRVDIIGCRFENNYTERNPGAALPPGGAPTEGGAVMVEDNVDVYVTGCYFENNRAMAGGAIHNYRGKLTISECVFENNTATGTGYLGYGGAVGCNSNEDPAGGDHPNAYLHMSDTVVRNCTAPVGGGVAYGGDGMHGLYSWNRGSAVFQNLVIDNCRATTAGSSYGNGGGLNLFHADVSASGLYVLNCTAENIGGAIVLDGYSYMYGSGNFIVGNNAWYADDSIHEAGSSYESMSSTVIAYNGGHGSASAVGFTASPPVIIDNNAYLAYVVTPYSSSSPPSISPSVGNLPNRGGYSAGTVVVPNVSTATTFTLSSQYADRQTQVDEATYGPPLILYPGEPIVGDFDNDGQTDYGVYYAPVGDWKIERSTEGLFLTQFGYSDTLGFAGDFDGDGYDDIGCYYPSGGNWYLSMSSNGYKEVQFGFAGTLPLVGDFDGDGKDDIGCYYPPSGAWYIFMSTDGFFTTQFGFDGTVPVVGDFDGDGKDDIGCYYPPAGLWFVFMSTDGFFTTQFGFSGTVPILGDFDGDGRDDIGCYYAPSGEWFIFMSTDGFFTTQFGFAGTVPVVGDFDVDGVDDIGCQYPPSGEWFIFKSTEGFATMEPVGSQ